MARKNIYVKDEDLPLWEKAEKLSDEDSLSRTITTGLKMLIQRQEAAKRNAPFERIELEVSTTNESGVIDGRRTIAFKGVEIACTGDVTVYQTAKRQLLFYYWHDLYPTHKVYADLDEANFDTDDVNDPDILEAVAEALGLSYVEELDI